MIDLLDSYDKALMLMLNFDGGAWMDTFWYIFSGKYIWVGVYAVILYKLYLSSTTTNEKWKALVWLIVATVLLITLCDQISSGIIKHLVERPRPSHNAEIENLLHYVKDYRGGKFGFVSSHAANSIGLAIWVSLLFRCIIFRATIILWSIMTCYSRIYLGVHYLGDIVGGLCVGIACAFIIYYLYRKLVPDSQQIAVEHKEPWMITIAIAITTVFIALM